jgi:hypothetical protein
MARFACAEDGRLAWPVNRASAMRRALDLDVDGIITNEPARLAGAAAARSAPRPGVVVAAGSADSAFCHDRPVVSRREPRVVTERG